MDILIDEISEAALQAIEKAAAEAARAAFMQSLEREAEAVREAQKYKNEAEILRQAGIKNNVVIGVICFSLGIAVGVVGTVVIIK